MGDLIPFKKRQERKYTNTVLWGDGMFGFNPTLVKHIFVANGTDICLMFHDIPEGQEFDGWELMIRCHDESECTAAYNDLIHILEDQYGIIFGDEQW